MIQWFVWFILWFWKENWNLVLIFLKYTFYLKRLSTNFLVLKRLIAFAIWSTLLPVFACFLGEAQTWNLNLVNMKILQFFSEDQQHALGISHHTGPADFITVLYNSTACWDKFYWRYNITSWIVRRDNILIVMRLCHKGCLQVALKTIYWNLFVLQRKALIKTKYKNQMSTWINQPHECAQQTDTMTEFWDPIRHDPL